MKNKWISKFITAALVLVIALSLIGCGSSKDNTGSTTNTVSSKTTVETTREITDMVGRKLTVPKEIKKVYTISPVGLIMVYTLAPGKLVGLNYELTEGEKKYTLEEYHKLPLLGGWYGKNGTGNIEEIIKVQPDIAISMGDIDQTTIATADRLQQQLGIPVVVVDGDLDKLDKAYEFTGEIMGEQARAKELGDYCRETVAGIKEKISQIPAKKRVRVYYAEGTKGLETDPGNSPHTQVLNMVGGINVADVPMQKGYGRTAVSLEQVLAWNPDVIITGFDKGFDNTGGFYSTVFKDAGWKNIKAVKDNKVYEIPSYPYDWFDRPPSVNRIIGIKWLANLLYPDYIKLDIVAEATEFYKKFYHRELTDQEVQELLAHAKVN